MYQLIKRIIKIVLVLFAIALILDLQYEGRSIRQWSKEYGLKASGWVFNQGKSLVGKDLKDLTPSSLPKLENTLKSLGDGFKSNDPNEDVKKNLEGDKQDPSKDQTKKAETSKSNLTHLDQLTDQDRAKLKALLEKKSKEKSQATSL